MKNHRNLRNRVAGLLLLTAFSGMLSAQPKASDYVAPVDIPVILSGNIGEIRANHFHSGIDIKTQGVIGKNILAAADGYVARIAVSPVGYGKALYVNHPNGTTTVYGHLESFNDRIAEYVRTEQYRRKAFAVDLNLSPGQLPVKQGEVIALSGNSGSSGGPHLHYEIRDGASQDPLNLLGRGLFPGVKDDTAPQFFNLWVIHVDTVRGVPVHTVQEKYPVTASGDEYTAGGDQPVVFASPGYFAVEVIDRKNGATNTMGLYTLEQTLDGNRNFGLTTDRVSFATTRHINTMVHYPLHKQAGYEVYRTYVSPQNGLPIYRGVVDRGIIRLTDSGTHEVIMRVTDDNGNTSRLTFRMVEGEKKETALKNPETMHPVPWDEKFEYRSGGLNVTIPANVLYESTLFSFEKLDNHRSAVYSPVYRIESQEGVPLQRAMTVSIRPDSLPGPLQSKACLASVGRGGGRIYEGGRWERGYVTGATRTFGDYFVTVDTVPPRIEATFQPGADLTNQRAFSLTMKDDFSGIATWAVEIDGEWALFDYDAKNNVIRHWFRDARYGKGKRHTLKAVATDNKGNRKEFTTEFVW